MVEGVMDSIKVASTDIFVSFNIVFLFTDVPLEAALHMVLSIF